MSVNRIHSDAVARLAREMAASGKCKDIMEIEAALILQGHNVTELQNPILRAELELLIDEVKRKT